MKRVIAGLMTMLVILSLVACGGQEPEDKMYDEDFIKDFIDGLEKRWDYSDKNTSTDEKESLDKAINLELDSISKYGGLPFEDSKLQEKSLAYINELKSGLDVLSTYGADSFYQDFEKHTAKRTQLITEINEMYPLEFKDKFQPTFEEFLSRGQEVIKEEGIQEEAEALLNNIKFEAQEPEYEGSDYVTYEATAENTSEYSFTSYSISIELMDEDGIVADKTYCYIDDWTPGKKVKIDFITDVDVKSMEVNLDSFYTD